MSVSNFIKKMMFSRQLNFEKGKFEMLGIRGVILPARTLTKFVEEMYKEEGDEAFEILFEAGKEHGRLGVEKLGKKNKVGKREFISEVIESGNVMGLGEAKVDVFNPGKGVLKIRLKNSPLEDEFKNSETLKDLDRSIDDFQRGVFHAMAESVFEEEIKSKETKCSYLGDRFCEFIIKTKD